MATHIDGQAANCSNDGFGWRHRFDATGFVLRGKLHELVGLFGLVTSFCSAVIWLGAAITGQSSILGMVLMTLLFLGSACAALTLWFFLRRAHQAPKA